MSLLCDYLGHKFVHDDWGTTVDVRRFFGMSSNITGEWKALYVKKTCSRCGYEFSDTFRIHGTENKLCLPE